MSERIIIFGAGGHAKVIADSALAAGLTVEGFLDDRLAGQRVLGIPVLGTLSQWEAYRDRARFVLGIGDNRIRQRLAHSYPAAWGTVIHPTAVIGTDVTLGEGTVVMAGAVVNAGSRIGRHCILNTGAIVEHDNTLEDFVHVSPHATLCGTVQVGALTHIGAGAVLRNNCSVAAGCTVGAGAVVVRSLPTAGVYVGVPARRQEL